ncbi:MAG TPA: hypothetical protein VMR20_02205 [Verrucomicrobiae bacterium]|jgi:hypothetical protein|nr:hypothetical protein [Verrucomicrobiae bacterium]
MKKPFSGPILALFFVLFILLSLLTVKPTSESGPAALADDTPRVSEVGLLVTFQR